MFLGVSPGFLCSVFKFITYPKFLKALFRSRAAVPAHGRAEAPLVKTPSPNLPALLGCSATALERPHTRGNVLLGHNPGGEWTNMQNEVYHFNGKTTWFLHVVVCDRGCSAAPLAGGGAPGAEPIAAGGGCWLLVA